MLRIIGILLVALTAQITWAGPDPVSIRKFATGHRYAQDGWLVLHIEGKPYDRGYQHGQLLSKEIVSYMQSLARGASEKAPSDGWNALRTLVETAFLRKIDREFLEEMRGIADGANDAGAKYEGRPLDLTDITTINMAGVELEFLDSALRATPNGLEEIDFAKPRPQAKPPEQPHHCSAFAATGPATKDGKIVFGHITMWNLRAASHFHVWIDIKPEKGHRVLMQSFPGGIFSGMDYYLSSSGLMLTETTIAQTRFNADGIPLAVRCRRAMQYTNSIDEMVRELTTGNNGLYTNEWLMGDANTNEIAALELGTSTYKLRRSSKQEWLLPGTEGFFWGCNNTKDLQVRLDTFATLTGRPADVCWCPSDRDQAWLALFKKHKGQLDVDFGKLAFGSAPLAKTSSLDAKVTTSDLVKRLQTHAVCGPPYQRVWHPSRGAPDDLQPMIPNDWTLLSPVQPVDSKLIAVDLTGRIEASEPTPARTTPAWTGTLLPQSDNDAWLTAGFADYERYVSLENELAKDGRLSARDQDKLKQAYYSHEIAYAHARRRRPAWREENSQSVDALTLELDRSRWHKEQAALGVLILHAVRQEVGARTFQDVMSRFGQAKAGKVVTAKDWIKSMADSSKKDISAIVSTWQTQPKLKVTKQATVGGWFNELEKTIIVYGTQGDRAANKEAAELLQFMIRNGGQNFIVPVVADTVTDSNWQNKHIVLIGRPSTNLLSKRFQNRMPMQFGPASFEVAGKLFAHEGTAVIVAAEHPSEESTGSIVMIAGMSAKATYFTVENLMRSIFQPAEAVVVTPDQRMQRFVMLNGPDKTAAQID